MIFHNDGGNKASEKQFFDNKKWMNSKEAAQYLGISVGNLRVIVSRGHIKVHGRLGRSWRFRRDLLDEHLELQSDYGGFK